MNPWELSLSLRYRPWAIFPVLLSLNTLLSLPTLGSIAKIWGSLGLILLLLLLSIARTGSSRPGPSSRRPGPLAEGRGPSFPAWPWVLLALSGLVPRFWNVLFSRRWTDWDNLFIGMNALQIREGSSLDLFTTFAQVSTLLPHLSALLFKVCEDPFFNLYFPPALLSACSLPIAWAASRQFFSKELSLILCGLLGFHYWALLPAQEWLFAAPFLAWQLSTFFLLGKTLNSRGRARKYWLAFLGGMSGLGYWTLPIWPVTLLVVLMFLGRQLVVEKGWGRSEVMAFLSTLLLTMSPFLWTLAHGGYGQHILEAGLWTDPPGPKQWATTAGAYLGSLLWGTDQGICQPFGGGFLNPIAGALFLLGVVELSRSREKSLAWALGSCAVIFLVPGLLAKGVETFRIHSLLPLLLLVTGIGLRGLTAHLLPHRRAWLCFLLVVSCGVWDLQRTFGNGFFPQKEGRPPVQRYQAAFRILEEKGKKEGPGLILSGLVPGEISHSVGYFSYPFNASLHARALSKEARWAAIFTRSYYGAPLRKAFPGMEWKDLPEEKGLQGPRDGLGILPLTSGDRKVLEEWDRYHSFQRSIQLEVMNLPNGASLDAVLKRMKDRYDSVPQHPFPQSCFFETLLFLYSTERNYRPQEGVATWEDFQGPLRRSFARSYRNEHLCQKYGRLLAMEGDLEGAKTAFREALRSRPGDAWLLHQLRELEGPTARP